VVQLLLFRFMPFPLHLLHLSTLLLLLLSTAVRQSSLTEFCVGCAEAPA
jgi:hypothetical protein